MLGAPASAVPGHDELGSHVGERVDGAIDDGLERWAAEVQATEQGVQGWHGGESLRVPHDVDCAGVTAAGQHQEAASPYMCDEGLVVDDQRVVLPFRPGPLLMGRWHTAFELGGPVDLSGDQNAAVCEQ